MVNKIRSREVERREEERRGEERRGDLLPCPTSPLPFMRLLRRLHLGSACSTRTELKRLWSVSTLKRKDKLTL